jgi:hypothetical protein
VSTLQHLAKDMDTDQPVQFYEKDVEAFMQVGGWVCGRSRACASGSMCSSLRACGLRACVRACVRVCVCARARV